MTRAGRQLELHNGWASARLEWRHLGERAGEQPGDNSDGLFVCLADEHNTCARCKPSGRESRRPVEERPVARGKTGATSARDPLMSNEEERPELVHEPAGVIAGAR